MSGFDLRITDVRGNRFDNCATTIAQHFIMIGERKTLTILQHSQWNSKEHIETTYFSFTATEISFTK